MKNTVKRLFRFIFVMVVIMTLAVPKPVLAQDAEPTVEPTTTEVVTDVPTEVATENPTEVATDDPTEVATEAATEAVPQPVTEVATEAATQVATEVATEVPTEAPIEVAETVADVVETLVEEDAVLMDENGNPLPMGSAEAAEAIAVADPWFVQPDVNPSGFKVIAYQSDCTGWTNPNPAYPGECIVSATPVQAAVDAAPAGSVVNLAAGLFIEQVEISKNLTLQGIAGSTIIQSPGALVDSFTTANVNYPIIYVHNADNVIIDGITVDGANKGNANYRFVGIGYFNAGGTISNNLIENIMDNPFSGSQHGVGIYAYNDDDTLRTLNIQNNVVEDFQKTGIALMGNGLTVNVDGNVVLGEGDTTITAQNGIQLSNGVTGSVTNNVIKDVEYLGSGWTSSGIIVQDTTGLVNVDNNQITNAQVGVYGYNAQVSASGNTVDESSKYGILSYNGSLVASNNTISNSKYGIYGYLAPVTASGNTFDSNTYGLVLFPPTNTNGTITRNMFINNGYGFYTTDPTISLRDNVFNLNTYGASLSSSTIGDARYNYWGCDLGGDPSNTAPCNSANGYNYSPWLMDPDGDGVYVSSDGTGGYVDNCPTIDNPDQADGDGDGFGDACDSTTTVTVPDKPYYEGQPAVATVVIADPDSAVLSNSATLTFTGNSYRYGAYGPTASAPDQAGTYHVVASYAGNGTYGPSTGSADFSITKITPVCAVTPYHITYDGNSHTAIGNCTGGGRTDLANYFNMSGSTQTNAGTYTFNWQFGPTANYNQANGTVQNVIDKKPATVRTDIQTKVYGETDPIFTGSLSDFLLVDGITAVYSRTDTSENVGDYEISAVLSPSGILGNYEITNDYHDLTITKRPITVTANPSGKIWTTPTDPLPFTYVINLGSLVVGDTLAGELSRDPGEAEGVYAITRGTLDNPNYAITFVSNTFTIIMTAGQKDTDVDGIKDDVDNCIFISNAAQKDTDLDGIGDACDSTPNGALLPLLVPVTGGAGTFTTFNCNSTTTLRLPTSDFVVASADLCNMEGELVEELKESLPVDLPDGLAFGFGMDLTILDGLSPLDTISEPGRLTFSFSIPTELRDKELTVFFWDTTLKEGAGDWVELPVYEEEEDGTPVITSLHPEEVSEMRMILEGVQKTELNRFEFVTNFPGLFVLAVK